MNNFQLRRYERADLDNIERLFKTHFEANHIATRKLIFDWIARHNPIAVDDTNYLIVEDNGRIIAYLGRMPVDLMINGEKQRGYFINDLLVDPEYRRKGLGLSLVSLLNGAWEDATDTFAVGIWMNEFTYTSSKRRGYYELNAHYFVKPVNLAPILMKIIRSKFVVRAITPFGHGLIGLYDHFISNRRYPDISISQIERFDQRFDTFADNISRKFPLIVLRHSKYLNWKYIDRPSANHTILTAERNGGLTGYIILYSSKSEDAKLGVIVDILADPDDSQTIASLCQAAINSFRKENVDVVVCFLTNKSFIRVFKKYLFFKRPKSVPIMITNLHKHNAQELIRDIGNWFLTYGDSDGFVWE